MSIPSQILINSNHINYSIFKLNDLTMIKKTITAYFFIMGVTNDVTAYFFTAAVIPTTTTTVDGIITVTTPVTVTAKIAYVAC